MSHLADQLAANDTQKRQIYLDYAATTPIDSRVIEAMVKSMESAWGNVSSPHETGKHAKAEIERALHSIANHFNIVRDEIIITSGATESINHALKGVMRAQKKREIITTTIEHKAVINTVQALMKEGYRGTFIAPNEERKITPEMIEAAISEETALISLIWVNNETGDKLPVEAIAEIARKHNVLIHIDATQAAPHFTFDASQFDLVSLSAHKCYGPKGVGLLYRRSFPRLPMVPIIDGSGGQLSLRAGTIPNEQVIGFAKALELVAAESAEENARFRRWQSYLLARLAPLGVTLNGVGDEESHQPGLLNLHFPGVNVDALLALTPDLALAKGSACNSDSSIPSYVLTEMHYPDSHALSSLRLSMGRFTTEEEIYAAGELLVASTEFLQKIARGERSIWFGDYDLYNPFIGTILEPDFVEPEPFVVTDSLTITQPHFIFTLDFNLKREAEGVKVIACSIRGTAAPYLLSAMNDLAIALRGYKITIEFKIEALLGGKIPPAFLRDILTIERTLKTLLNEG